MSLETISLQAQLLADYAKSYPSDAMRAVVTKGTALVNEYGTAAQPRQAEIEKEIADHVTIAKNIVSFHAPKSSMGVKEKFGIAALIIIAGLVVGFVVWYVWSRGPQNLTSLDSIRPILVLTLIISTITFGGALIIGSLYSEGETLEARFRHAREIFLVFSGIFGTVIGFYFGAGESKGLLQALSVSADLVGTTLKGQVVGGTPPYRVTLTYGDQTSVHTLESSVDLLKHEFDKAKDDIQTLKVEVVDSKDQKSTWNKDFTSEQLKTVGFAKYQRTSSATDKGEANDKKAGSKSQAEPGVQTDKPIVPPAATVPVVPKKP